MGGGSGNAETQDAAQAHTPLTSSSHIWRPEGRGGGEGACVYCRDRGIHAWGRGERRKEEPEHNEMQRKAEEGGKKKQSGLFGRLLASGMDGARDAIGGG